MIREVFSADAPGLDIRNMIPIHKMNGAYDQSHTRRVGVML
jgi:hypothetical protein